MKRLIIATMLVSTGAMAQSAYEIPSIEVMANQPILPQRQAAILPVAPISRTGPTTVWQSGSYTYIDEPDNQTTVYQNGSFTYITPQRGPSTTCQTIGRFTYCN